MGSNIRFLSSVLVLCVFGVAGASAAPSVRMLGTNTARVGSNATVVKSENRLTPSTTTQRLGSIRPTNLGTAVPVTVNKASGSTETTNVAASSDGSRLGLGKYVHANTVSTNSIKPSQAVPAVTQDDFTTLTDRVSNLESGIESKQASISVGDGLILEDNSISFNEDFAELPNRFDELSGDLDNLAAEVDDKVSTETLAGYYTKEEVDAQIEANVGPNSKTIYDLATGRRKYVSIADRFSESVLED